MQYEYFHYEGGPICENPYPLTAIRPLGLSLIIVCETITNTSEWVTKESNSSTSTFNVIYVIKSLQILKPSITQVWPIGWWLKAV